MLQNQISNFSEKIKNDLKKMNQWPALREIFEGLDKKNRLCWISGGAVRDLILSRTPLDFDLTTDATEGEILELFPQAILVGQAFGVYKIPKAGEIFDLTVFREEDEYIDGRRPVSIRRSTPEKDAHRRDFTINGLYWDMKNEVLVDYVGGLQDLANQIIRCVGEPSKRFDEDYLRILRMIRFGYSLDFHIDEKSYEAGLLRANLLIRISGERILAEILKLSVQQSRLKFYADPLFLSIMKHNDLSLVDVSSKINLMKQTVSVEGLTENDRILIELLFLRDFQIVHVQQLQARLKISHDAKKWLIKCVEINELIQKKSDFVQFCLLIDKSKNYLVLVHY
ncbi:MAG: CCA tRNA nucleotidyltransferase, partial [Moraxellaceae bacterium]|nr:CCA tRNA nucleotidyltransferase [Pseudobdellovibrionaceae bacterium]